MTERHTSRNEGTVVFHETARPADIVAAFRSSSTGTSRHETDDDVGALVLLEPRPHRWLFGLGLPTLPAG